MSRRRLLIPVLTAIVALAIVAGAFAYMSAQGSGTGLGSASITLQDVTVTGATATQSLLPTGSATGDLNLTLVNDNSGPVHVGSLTLDTSQGTGGFSPNAASCALSFAGQTNGGNGWSVGANSSLGIDLTNSVTMGTSAASSCQGQSFTVYLKAS